MAVAAKITVSWTPLIETPRLILRPIQADDLPAYREIFNSVAMQHYRGSFTEARFHTWLARWQEHKFSALAIIDKTSEKADVIGHAILGHGDYEGTTEKGWTEIAFILNQAYWNAQHAKPEQGIGTKGAQGLGSEVVEGLMQYAKDLTKRGISVPADINPDQLEEVKDRELYYEKGTPKAVLLPLTEIRATCDKTNAASLRILKAAFKVSEGIGTEKEVEGDRPGFAFSILTADL